MWKDGDLDEYNSYEVSINQELIWKNELTANLYSNLEVKHDSTLTGLLIMVDFFNDNDLFIKVVNFISSHYVEADSFLKIRYAENLWDMVRNCKNFNENCSQDHAKRAINLVIKILEDVLNHEIVINKESERILEFNQNIPNDEYLIQRATDLYQNFEV